MVKKLSKLYTFIIIYAMSLVYAPEANIGKYLIITSLLRYTNYLVPTDNLLI